ncbi:MAG: baseplate hub protein [Candidatus Avelusimicrobium sp.]|uniref:baseplate hub protein n=1 Tax=Candidatus Avelusimicrobium sp. TaxID=3048833 RepID=UPI003F11F70A
MPTQLPKRYARVEVEVSQNTADGKVTHALQAFEGLNVRFNIVKRAGSTMNRAEVAICNLKKSTVDYLTTINALEQDQKNRKVIRLFAGYEGQTGQIFEGDIIRALPSAPPDVWLQAQCLSGYHNNLQLVTLALNGGVDIKEICSQAAAQLNLKLEWNTTQKKKVDQFVYQGPMTAVIRQLNELKGIRVYQDDDRLVVEDENPAPPEAGDTVRQFSLKSGLIGLPEPDLFGVKFKVLLDPSLRCGQAVRLESMQIPAASGLYYIYSITHRGELRAEPWYSELSCRTYGTKN